MCWSQSWVNLAVPEERREGGGRREGRECGREGLEEEEEEEDQDENEKLDKGEH